MEDDRHRQSPYRGRAAGPMDRVEGDVRSTNSRPDGSSTRRGVLIRGGAGNGGGIRHGSHRQRHNGTSATFDYQRKTGGLVKQSEKLKEFSLRIDLKCQPRNSAALSSHKRSRQQSFCRTSRVGRPSRRGQSAQLLAQGTFQSIPCSLKFFALTRWPFAPSRPRRVSTPSVSCLPVLLPAHATQRNPKYRHHCPR